MIIDGHSHLTFPVEEHIEAMDRAGVDKPVLFSATFHPEAAQSAEEAKAAMQYLGDLLAGKKGSMVEARKKSIAELVNAIRKFPDRYVGFGAVPVGLDLKATKRYIEENIQGSHLVGLGEFALGSNQVRLLEPVFAASEEFANLPIWIHAFFPFTLRDIRDTAQLAKKHPNTPVILGHLGGENWMNAMELAREIPNLYLDTSAYYSTFVLKLVINEVPEKCIFGVDRPFGDLELAKEAILKLAKTPAVARAVLGETIERILNLSMPNRRSLCGSVD